MIFAHIKNFLQTHKKTLFFIAIIIGIFYVSTDFALAADEGTGISKEDSDKIIGAINMLLKGAAAILGVVTSFISIFLYPGWVNGTMFGLQDYLREIWILVSNVVYFLFALILIAIAFMNIIGKGDGTWELKQAMPKFIVGVLIVPFSWFIVQFILSISAILTVGVLTLPYDSFENKEFFQNAMKESELASEMFCKDIVISLTGNFDGVGGKNKTQSISNGADSEFSENIRCKANGKVSIKNIMEGTGNASGIDNTVFGVISVYTYGILRVQELDTLKSMDLTTVKGVMDLIFKFVFDALFVVVYMLLMVALFLALLTRGIRLWVFMMLSPVFGLLYFFGKTDGGGKMEKFSPKEFIALAMVPVYAAAALAFGLTFILVATEGIKVATSEDDLDTLRAGGFSLTIIGAHGDGGVEEKSVIGKLIVELFGVAILWIAVMAALGASKTTSTIVEPIAQFGNSVGELMSKAPTYAPIIPTGGGESMSAAGLGRFGTSIKSGIETKAVQGGGAFADKLMGNGTEGYKELNTSLTRLNNSIRSSSTPIGTLAEEFKDSIHATDAEKLRSSQEFRKTVKDLGDRLDIDGIDVGTDDKLAISIDKIISHFETNGARNIDWGLAGMDNRNAQDLRTWDRFAKAKSGSSPDTRSAAEPQVTPSNQNTFTFNETKHISTSGGNRILSSDGIDEISSDVMTSGVKTVSDAKTRARTMLASVQLEDHDDEVQRIIDAIESKDSDFFTS